MQENQTCSRRPLAKNISIFFGITILVGITLYAIGTISNEINGEKYSNKIAKKGLERELISGESWIIFAFVLAALSGFIAVAMSMKRDGINNFFLFVNGRSDNFISGNLSENQITENREQYLSV